MGARRIILQQAAEHAIGLGGPRRIHQRPALLVEQGVGGCAEPGEGGAHRGIGQEPLERLGRRLVAAEPGQQPRPGQGGARALVPGGVCLGDGGVGVEGVVGPVGGLESAGPGHRHLGGDRIAVGQVHEGAEGRGRLRGPAQRLEAASQAGQGADAERGVVDGRGRSVVGSGHQPELLGGAVVLPGGQGGLGDPEPGARQGLAGRALAGELRERLVGLGGMARAEMGGDEVRQGEFGDLAARVRGQVALQGRDRVGVSAGLDVRLPQQEQGIGGEGAGRLVGQAGEELLGVGRSLEGAVGQRQLVAGVLGEGRGERWGRLDRAGGGRFEQGFEQGRRRLVVAGQGRGAGLDQPGLAAERAVGEAGGEPAGQPSGRRGILAIEAPWPPRGAGRRRPTGHRVKTPRPGGNAPPPRPAG